MTIAAESFVGRVLAVFSRRSAGFRPPLKASDLLSAPDGPATSQPAPVPDGPRPRETPQADPAQEGVKGLSLADVMARWKSASPQERLRFRSALQEVAVYLKTASEAPTGEVRDSARFDARVLARTLGLTLARALALSRDLERDLDRIYERIRERYAAAHDFADYRDLAADFDIDIDIARVLSRARALDREAAHNLDRELDRDLDRICEAARDDARNLDREAAREFARALAHDRALAPVPDPDLLEAHGNLAEAANNFLGADCTNVDPAGVNLAGIRWDSDTRWPTLAWTARIRRASVEDSPGSGVFVVLPEESRNFVVPGSVAPIS